MKKGTKVQWNYSGFDEKGNPKENPNFSNNETIALAEELSFQQFFPWHNYNGTTGNNGSIQLIGLDKNGVIKNVNAGCCKVDPTEVKNQALLG